jgi:hypothetical protein
VSHIASQTRFMQDEHYQVLRFPFVRDVATIVVGGLEV